MLLQISGVFMFLEQSPLGYTNSQRYVSIFLYINAFFGSSIMTFADTLDDSTSLRFIQKYESIEEYELEIMA